MTPTFLIGAMPEDRAAMLLAKLRHLGLLEGLRRWVVVDRHTVTIGVETADAMLWGATSDGVTFTLSVSSGDQRTRLEGSATMIAEFLYRCGLSRLELVS